jgi:hypothetical protein
MCIFPETVRARHIFGHFDESMCPTAWCPVADAAVDGLTEVVSSLAVALG